MFQLMQLKWTLSFICAAIVCFSLGPVNNGAVVYSTDLTNPFDFGTAATITCDEGYFLEGQRMLTCGGNALSVTGMWNHPTPVCAGMCLLPGY